MMVIPAVSPVIIISIEYPGDDARRWARLYDNQALGWIVDENMPVPQKPAAPISPQPYPLIIGSFPLPATDTNPIISPQWCKYDGPALFVPDVLRSTFSEFLTWLATNNGAHRPLQARFVVHSDLMNGFNDWAAANPDLVFDGEPPPPPPG
jgi:hypothetical protein